MTGPSFVSDYFDHFCATARPSGIEGELIAVRDALASLAERDRCIFLAGNGASASLASHFAVDFTKQAGLRARSFTDVSLVTAYGNDYGYEEWVARALDHHARSGDAVILISSSGASPNMVRAAQASRGRGLTVIALTGFAPDNPLRQLGDLGLWADSRAYNVVEAVHGLWMGMICDMLVGAMEYSVRG